MLARKVNNKFDIWKILIYLNDTERSTLEELASSRCLSVSDYVTFAFSDFLASEVKKYSFIKR